MRKGELAFIAPIGLLGALGVLLSSELPYSDEGVPAAGYFPLWIGVILVALTILHVVLNWSASPVVEGEEPADRRRLYLVALGLVACVIALGFVGFPVAVAAYLAFLFGVVERLRWPTALGAAAGVTGLIFVLFRTLLAVPLPQGPWGF